MADTENPFAVADLERGADGEAALEVARAKLKQADDISEATVDAMERLMDLKLAKELSDKTPAEVAIREVVARLTEAPCNWHQSVAFFAALPVEDADAGRRWWALAVGALMVLGQTMVAIGMAMGTLSPTCETNDMCAQAGTYCAVGSTNRCNYCGMDIPLPQQVDLETGKILNRPMQDFGGWNKTAIAETCADPSLGKGIVGDVADGVFTFAGVKSWCEACVFVDGEADRLTFLGLISRTRVG